jgi:N-acetylglucosaminyldiphosphoundecaprenol N-acetyl-beta-D-mannosaminyltransferase
MHDVSILGLKVTSATLDEIHQAISRIVASGGPGFVLSANVHGFNLARENPWLADFYNQADLVHVDGSGILLAGKILGRKIEGGRLTWADWAWPLADYLAKEGHRLFLLGGPEGLAAEAAEKLVRHAPGLNVVGAHHGYFAKEGPENDRMVDLLNQAAPDVLWVGLGMPLQERWILDNHHRLNAKVYMVCGAAFRHMAGWLKRSPEIFIRLHSEWLWLLFQNPSRGLRRYLYGNPAFLYHVVLEKLGWVPGRSSGGG